MRIRNVGLLVLITIIIVLLVSLLYRESLYSEDMCIIVESPESVTDSSVSLIVDDISNKDKLKI